MLASGSSLRNQVFPAVMQMFPDPGRFTKHLRKVMEYSYAKAVSRNIGWVTEVEQGKLRAAKVAIAGLGGVGGAHLLTLSRLGISNFHISDFDDFDVHNLNRQAGAFMPFMGHSKIETLAKMARDINPESTISLFPHGVNPENVDEFLEGVDVYVDGLDFFALPARRMVFAKCREKGIPALTAAPLGMGTAFLHFSPTGMSFEQYFKVEGHTSDEQYARFIAGLSPAMVQRDYLVAPEAVNFAEKRGPSTVMACDLCAGVMGTNVLKVLLGRGKMRAAPWGMHFDAYHQTLKHTWRPFGNSNPLQQLLLKFIRPKLRGNP
jgi:molybdopterin/thiamine biosynthesis adenylyltransferase